MGAGRAINPDYPGPHSFMVFAVIITTICGILNLLSLACGVPAIILAGLVSKLLIKVQIIFSARNHIRFQTLKHKYKREDYPKAKYYGRCAFILTLSTMIFTLVCALVIICSITGALSQCPYLRANNYYGTMYLLLTTHLKSRDPYMCEREHMLSVCIVILNC